MQGIFASLAGGFKSSSGCSGIQGIYDQLNRGVHLPAIYIYMQCSSIQGIYAQLTGGLDLGVSVLVFKTSMID